MNLALLSSALLNPAAASSFVQHLCGIVVSATGEGVLLASAIALCIYLVPDLAAGTRFVVWTVAFAVLALLPLLNILLGGPNDASRASSFTPHLQIDPGWSYAFAAIWFAAAFGRLVQLVLEVVRVRALWNSASPVDAQLLSELSLGNAELCVSPDVDRPSVIGFFAPRILIPARLFDQLTKAELEQIVQHELEHLRRRDDWVNLMQKLCLAIFPLNPALFWIDRRLAAEREFACDDGVLRRTRAPRAYAICLTQLAERRLEHSGRNRLTMLALGAVGAVRGSNFSRRIESILGFNGRSVRNTMFARTVAASLVAAMVGSAATLARAPQLVSFDLTAPPNLAHAAADAGSAESATKQISPLRFENVSFHLPHPAKESSPSPRPVKQRLKAKPRPEPVMRVDTVYPDPVPSHSRRMLVMTSWRERSPQPVLITLPDGQTFLATYAADQNQVGWLILQL